MAIQSVLITVENGIKKITSPDLQCVISMFDRGNISAADEQITSDFICYIIYDEFYKKEIEPENVYFGHSTGGVARLINHDKNKPNWNKAIIISSSEFDRDMLVKLEYDLIEKGRFSHNYKVENKKLSERYYLTEPQEIEYEKFKPALFELLEVVNINIFSIDTDGVFVKGDLKVKVDSYEEKVITILKGSVIPNTDVSVEGIQDYLSRGEITQEKIYGLTKYTVTCDIPNVDSKAFFNREMWSYRVFNKNNMSLYTMFKDASSSNP